MKKVTIVVAILKDLMKIDSLSRCFSSIKSQQGVNKEVIVVSNFDFNSQIKELIKPTEGLSVFWENYSTLSLGQLRNLAIEKSTGDYICFLNPNDFLVTDSLKRMVDSLQKDNSKICIGQVMYYNSKESTYSYKGKNNLFYENSLNIYDNENLLTNLDLNNKLFDLDFLKQYNIQFSSTNYYDYLAFQLNAYIKTNNISLSPILFYNECVISGLDKVEYPKLEERIDERQIYEFVQVFSEVYSTIQNENSSIINNIIINLYLKFFFDRGLKYINIVDDKFKVLEELSKPLIYIDIEQLNRNNRQKTILNLIKNHQFEKYFMFISEEKARKLKQKSLAKHFKRRLFINLYNFCEKLPIKKKSVLFISHSPGMDGNYPYIQNAIKEYNLEVNKTERFTIQSTSTKISSFKKLFLPYKLARAEFILVAEYIPFFQLIEFRPETKIIQTWHAAGAFKKFGYSTSYLDGGPNPFTNTKMHLHRGYNYATVSSEEVRKHYADAFEIDIENVIPVGFPRADFFYNEEEVAKTRERIYELYPQLNGKKVILYAPTFRGFGKKRSKFKIEFDFNQIAKMISDEYIIALKMHPSVKSTDIVINPEVAHKILDISSYKDANDILTVTDLLITDYSSIIFDYSLLKKPMLFFAYDLDEYRYDRDFYYEYETFVPGPIAKTNEEIIQIINDWNFDMNVVEKFSKTFFVNQEGNHSEKFVKEVLVKLSR